MPNDKPLTPANRDDVQQSLAFVLRFQGRKRIHTADEAMARITAERLVDHLRQSGFVIMKKPPAPWPTDSGHRHAAVLTDRTPSASSNVFKRCVDHGEEKRIGGR